LAEKPLIGLKRNKGGENRQEGEEGIKLSVCGSLQVLKIEKTRNRFSWSWKCEIRKPKPKQRGSPGERKRVETHVSFSSWKKKKAPRERKGALHADASSLGVRKLKGNGFGSGNNYGSLTMIYRAGGMERGGDKSEI